MKLVAASAALLASAYSAQSIDTLIGQLIDQVYQHDPISNTHTVNISPYWNAVYTMKADGFTGEGTYGNGDGKINFSEELSFTDTSLDFELSQNGPVKASPFVSLAPYIGMSVPVSVSDDTFEDTASFSVNTEGISYSDSGNFNGDQYSHSVSLNLDSFSMSRTKISATVVFSHEAEHSSSIDQAYTNYMIPAGSSSVKVVANAKKLCAENPLDQSCTAKVVVTGDFNSADIGKSVAKWSVQSKKANFQITHNSQEIFWMGLLGIDTWQVLSLKYRLNGGRAVLVAQVVGPAGFQAVAAAATEFFAPYGSFFGAIDSGDDAAHIAAYFDKVVATWDNELFNVYPIFEATKFESDLLKDYALNGVKVQKFAENMCNTAADAIVGFSQANVGPTVTKTRSYINKVTGPEGEAQFDAWFAAL